MEVLLCIALLITAISKSAVCCCSATRMWRQKTKSDSSQTSSSNACRFIPNSLRVSSAYTLRCITLHTFATMKPVCYSSSRRQTSLRWTGAAALCVLAISTHPCHTHRVAEAAELHLRWSLTRISKDANTLLRIFAAWALWHNGWPEIVT